MVKKEGSIDTVLAKTLFTYSLSHLESKDKVRFFYALKGRNNCPGIIEDLGLIQLGKTVIISTPNQEDIVTEFLEEWGCPHSKIQILLRPDDPVIQSRQSRSSTFGLPPKESLLRGARIPNHQTISPLQSVIGKNGMGRNDGMDLTSGQIRQRTLHGVRKT